MFGISTGKEKFGRETLTHLEDVKVEEPELERRTERIWKHLWGQAQPG